MKHGRRHSTVKFMLKSLLQILLVFLGTMSVVSCGDSAPETAAKAAETGNAAVKIKRANWRLSAGGDAFEGNIAFVHRSDGKLHIQLVNHDAVNLAMEFPEEGAAARKVEHAFFALARKQPCRLVTSDPPYLVTLDPRDGTSLNGTFSGRLGCSDYSGLELQGSFEIMFAERQP